MRERESFEIATKAFQQMTLDEREAVLVEFAKLKYLEVVDRFIEGVYRVIVTSHTIARVPYVD